jgi:hypothetical protein
MPRMERIGRKGVEKESDRRWVRLKYRLKKREYKA